MYNLLGLLYQGNDQHSKALESFSYCIELDPCNYDAIYNKGVIYYETKDYKNALEQFSDCVKAKPYFLEAVSNLGVSEIQVHSLEKAKLSFLQALDIFEQNKIDKKLQAMLFYNLGNVCRLKENYDEAIAWYTKALDITPDDYKIYQNRGCCHHCKYRVYQALSDYNKAIEIQGNEPEILMNRAQLYTFQLNYYNALEDLTIVIEKCELKGNFTELYSNAQKLYKFCKNWQWSLAVACKDFVAAMSITPGIKNLSTTDPNLDKDIFHPPNLLDPSSRESIFITNSLSLLSPDDKLYEALTLAFHYTKTMDFKQSITPLYQALYSAPVGTQLRHVLAVWTARIEEIYNNNLLNAINCLTSCLKTEARYVDELPVGDSNIGPMELSLATLYTYLGNLLELQNRPGEAYSCYEAALKRDPEYLFGLINMSYFLIRNGNFKPALTYLVKVSQLQSKVLGDTEVGKCVYVVSEILKEYNEVMSDSTLNIQRLSRLQGKLAREMENLKIAIGIAEDKHYEARHAPLCEEMKNTMKDYTNSIKNNV